ncbi:hypothetical protein IFO70_38905 [Phormidium tenue FACHB-886]|nr:hypothetical protein [Phormidium tenue FACHB-886]
MYASVCKEPSVKCRHRATGECLRTLKGQRNRVWSVAFSPAGTTLASGSNDQTVKIWDILLQTQMQVLRMLCRASLNER